MTTTKDISTQECSSTMFKWFVEFLWFEPNINKVNKENVAQTSRYQKTSPILTLQLGSELTLSPSHALLCRPSNEAPLKPSDPHRPQSQTQLDRRPRLSLARSNHSSLICTSCVKFTYCAQWTRLVDVGAPLYITSYLAVPGVTHCAHDGSLTQL